MKTEDKLSFGEKVGYGVGDFGANLIFQTVMLYLMYFFTDVFLISASTAGIISFVSKIWDGVTDPVMGLISDRTKTRWGSKRPYLLFGAIPLGLIFFFLFYSPPIVQSMRVWYALILFLLLNTTYTIVNIPYGALTANMALSTHERSSITGYRMFFALIATLFIAGATKPLVGLFPTEAEGFRYVMGFYGLLAALFTLTTFFSVRERFHSKDESFPLSDIGKVLKANPPFLFLTLGTIFHLAAVSLIASMVNYFFKYNMKSEKFIPVAFVCLLGSAILSLPIWIKISHKLEKKIVYNSGMILLSISLLPFYFIKEFDYFLFIPLLITAGCGMSTIYLSPWSMIPDTVEYSQLETGLRREGILYGFFYFGQKLAAGLALLVSGLGLQMIGYISPANSTNILQTEEVFRGILLLITVVPASLILIGSIFISRYPITNRLHAEIVEKIKNQK